MKLLFFFISVAFCGIFLFLKQLHVYLLLFSGFHSLRYFEQKEILKKTNLSVVFFVALGVEDECHHYWAADSSATQRRLVQGLQREDRHTSKLWDNKHPAPRNNTR